VNQWKERLFQQVFNLERVLQKKRDRKMQSIKKSAGHKEKISKVCKGLKLKKLFEYSKDPVSNVLLVESPPP